MKEWFVELWDEFIEWMQDLVKSTLTSIKDLSLDLFELSLEGIVFSIGLIAPPDVLATSISALSAGLPSSVSYLLGQTGLSEGLAIYGSGVMFRIARKVYTLGQW